MNAHKVFRFLHFTQKESIQSKKRDLKTLCACTPGHLGQWLDKSPMYEGDSGVVTGISSGVREIEI